MIQHVWEKASQAALLTDLIVATDDPAIVRAVEAFGGRAVLTGPAESGTDRVAAIAKDHGASLVVNLQGDEPLLDPHAIDALVRAVESDAAIGMATLAVHKSDPRELADPNVVKVVTRADGEALHFSRAPLRADSQGGFLKHIGVYAFRRDVLLRFCAWPPSALERAERLEQLRALENGVRIRVVRVERDTVAVDVPDDIARVEARLREAL